MTGFFLVSSAPSHSVSWLRHPNITPFVSPGGKEGLRSIAGAQGKIERHQKRGQFFVFTPGAERRPRRSFIKSHGEKHYWLTGKNTAINKLGESWERCKRSTPAAFRNVFKPSVFIHSICLGSQHCPHHSEGKGTVKIPGDKCEHFLMIIHKTQWFWHDLCLESRQLWTLPNTSPSGFPIFLKTLLRIP